jgi:predicted DNA binding CopG/RHH family protein
MPKPKPKIKPIPGSRSEDEEREFWAGHDATDYVDCSAARRVVLPNLTPTTTPVSVRLPESLLGELERLAHEQDVPYQSLMKIYLSERVALERRRRRRKARSRFHRV